MTLSPTPKPLIDLIRHAIDSEVIDGWGHHGPYLVFMNGSARFYVRRHEAEGFVGRLMHDAPPFEHAAA